MKRRGEISVFLALTIVCMMSLVLGLLESARTAGARLYLQMAANSSMSSLLSHYNRNLWDRYHLLFLECGSGGAMEDTFSSYLDFYLEQKNLYPMQRAEVLVTETQKMADHGGELLEAEIRSCMRYYLPELAADLFGFAGEAAKVAGGGDFRNLFEVCRKAGEKTRRLEKSRLRLEKYLTGMRKAAASVKRLADEEQADAFRRQAGKLAAQMERFSSYTADYEAEAKAIQAYREKLAEAGNQPETCTDENMAQELAACGQVEEAAFRTLEEYRRMEEETGKSRQFLLEALEILEETDIGGNPEDSGDPEEDEEDGPDWGSIRECLEEVTIPEAEVREPSDSGKEAALDRLEKILSGDLLELVLPAGTEVSKTKVSLAGIPSASGEPGETREKADSGGRLLVNEYCLMNFGSFLTPSSQETVLQYEQEYLLYGAASDRENLKEAVKRLLSVRGSLNLAFLLASPEKEAKAAELAASLSGGSLPVQVILNFFILALWAFGEAVWDVKTLLAGGAVPIWKNERTWKLDLDGLLTLGFLEEPAGRAEDHSESGGKNDQGYTDYMRILFLMTGWEERNGRIMDLIQWNMRITQPDFSVADCIGTVRIRMKIRQKHLFLVKNTYDTVLETAGAYQDGR